jgi:hypothetical protein
MLDLEFLGVNNVGFTLSTIAAPRRSGGALHH